MIDILWDAYLVGVLLSLVLQPGLYIAYKRKPRFDPLDVTSVARLLLSTIVVSLLWPAHLVLVLLNVILGD